MPKNLRRSSSSQLETGLSPFRRHRLWMLVVLLLGGLYALASLPLCPQGPPSPPRLLSSQTAATPLEVGAAKAEIRVPRWPIVIAGYGPPRSEAMEQTLPLYARAVVLKAEGFELSLLSVDILMVSGGFVDILRQRLGGEVWTVPTHSHSSLGGVDERWQAQIAAMGRFDEAAQQALLQACLEAVEEARKNLRAARFAWEESTPEDWTRPRSGTQVDRRLLRLRWQDEAGPIAQILLLSGHPTLVRAKATQLNPDYPGELALLEESAGRGLTLVWPSAVANARISLEEASPQTVALTLHKHLQAWLPPNPYPTSPTPPNQPNPPPGGEVTPPNAKPTPPGDAAEPLGDEVAPPGDAAAALGEVYHARIGFALPSMDLSRLVPKLLQGPAANLLCQGIAPEAELSLLRLGGLSLLGVPFEVSGEAAFALESAGLGRSVSVSNNYLGYLETSDNVEAHAGESSLQYFNKTLLERMVQAVDP